MVERNKLWTLQVGLRLKRCEQEVTLGALGGLWLAVTQVAALRCRKKMSGRRCSVESGLTLMGIEMVKYTQPFLCCHGHEPTGSQGLNIRDCCCTMPSYPHLWPSSSLPVAEQRMVTMNSIRWVNRIVCFPSKEQHLLYLALLGIMSVLNQTNSTLRLFEVLILHISVWVFLFGFFGCCLFVFIYLFGLFL